MEIYRPTDEPVRWLDPPEFTFAGRSYRYFFHYHNCGWPPDRCTERSVELALANYWLNCAASDRVLEIGTVTPYYWPRRIVDIVDPVDQHMMVTRRSSIFQVDCRGRAVLSISTLEHIGMGQYGLAADPPQALEAMAKVFAEATQFLLTIPVGYNPLLDTLLFKNRAWPTDVAIHYLVRVDAFRWREEKEPARACLPYGEFWANSIAVLERGGILGP